MPVLRLGDVDRAPGVRLVIDQEGSDLVALAITVDQSPRARSIVRHLWHCRRDWRTGITAAVERFAKRHSIAVDAAEVADSWRAQYQPSMEPIRAGARQYVPLDTLHRESLEQVLTSQGVETSDGPCQLV